LAELTDAVAEMISQITSLITGDIEGNLSNTQVQQLTKWAKDNKIE